MLQAFADAKPMSPVQSASSGSGRGASALRRRSPRQLPSVFLVEGLLGRGELHQFHLVELVLADETPHVRAVGSGFAPEAWEYAV
jgi:hypothetical protein